MYYCFYPAGFNLPLDLRPEEGQVIPSNIFDMLTPLGLAYWICDDGTFEKKTQAVILCTESFDLDGVKLLQEVLVDKFKSQHHRTCFAVPRCWDAYFFMGCKSLKKIGVRAS